MHIQPVYAFADMPHHDDSGQLRTILYVIIYYVNPSALAQNVSQA